VSGVRCVRRVDARCFTIMISKQLLYNSSKCLIFRIRSETGGGAWCPLGMISKDNVEYLEIDLGGLKVITLIETQGRFGHGQVGH